MVGKAFFSFTEIAPRGTGKACQDMVLLILVRSLGAFVFTEPNIGNFGDGLSDWQL